MLGVACVAFVWSVPIIATNDGPVHLSFADILRSYYNPDSFLERRLFQLDFAPEPNWVCYALLYGLLSVFSPEVAEKIVQALCLLIIPLGGAYAVSRLRRENVWLALFLFPFAFSQMFFLGLYNFCISLGVCLFALGWFLDHKDRESPWSGAVLCLTLTAAYFCHAMAFIAAFAGIAALSAADFFLDWRPAGGFRVTFTRALARRRSTLAALLPGAGLFVWYLLTHADSATQYGIRPMARLRYLLKSTIIDVNSRLDRYVGVAIVLTLFLLALKCLMERYRAAAPGEARGAPRSWAPSDALFGLFICFGVLALAIPDASGGGWTHFRRASLLPYFGCLLWLSSFGFSRRLTSAAVAIAVLCSAAMIGSAYRTQARIAPQMAEFLEASPYIEDHSTYLPIVFERRASMPDGHTINITFEPFFQAANRFELAGDRVSLFNYLARLSVYPVRYRGEVDPDRLLFHWQPEERTTEVKTVDLDRFERTTGIRIDYVLVWGKPLYDDAALANLDDVLARDYREVFRSASGRLGVYRRREVGTLTQHP